MTPVSSLQIEHEAAEAALRLPSLLANAETLAATLSAGAHGRRRSGPGETFWQYRDYTQNDPASSIDWRQSARSPRRYFVRETEWETAATIRLWCQGGASLDYSSGDHPSKRWRASVIATALALLLTKSGEKIGSLPAHGPSRSGQRAVISFAEQAVGYFDQEQEPLPPICPSGTTQAVYISDFHAPTTELIDRLKELAALGIPIHLIQIADPAEEKFPFSGRTVFEGPGGDKKQRLFGDAATIADDYRARREAHFGVVSDFCRQFGMTFLRHQTNHPATPLLALAHSAIAGDVI